MNVNKEQLIESLKKNGISDKVAAAFQAIKREEFVPERIATYAYEDIPLPIEDGVTLSQPFTVGFMLDQLNLQQNQKILEIGSGSGYVLALMSNIIEDGKVCGVEINQRLAIKSKNLLSTNEKIEVFNREGSQGLPELAPFDRILISAACPDRYVPYHLVDQLTPDGILVAAVKDYILILRKEQDRLIEQEFPGFLFVPLVKK